MKKLAVFLLVGMLSICGLFIPKTSIFELEASEYSFVTTAEAAEEAGLEYFENGSDVIALATDRISAEEFYKKYSPKCVVMKMQAGELGKLKEFLKLSQSFSQKLQDKEIIYAYTSLFPDCEFVDGKKINVQLVCEGNRLIVGFPVIMTSY